MNRKTILSLHFPDFVEKWKKFQNNFKRNNSWYITSDYCLDDKNRETIMDIINRRVNLEKIGY